MYKIYLQGQENRPFKNQHEASIHAINLGLMYFSIEMKQAATGEIMKVWDVVANDDQSYFTISNTYKSSAMLGNCQYSNIYSSELFHIVEKLPYEFDYCTYYKTGVNMYVDKKFIDEIVNKNKLSNIA